MKILFSVYILSLTFLNGFSQLKPPTSINLIKDFYGVITFSATYNGQFDFTIKELKSGEEITFYFSTDGNGLNSDPYAINCKISEDLNEKLLKSEAEGIKVKVKAKSAYGNFDNLADAPNFKRKRIIWRPIEVLIVK
jgi:hypothetical protein